MQQTPRLNLSLLAAAQAQKHVTLNDALLKLDSLVQASIITSQLATPPVSPAIGDSYIVGPSATGAWNGQEKKIASFDGFGWNFLAPRIGWTVYQQSLAQLFSYDGTNWNSANPAQVEKFGIGTPANLPDVLAVAGESILFTHSGDDHRVKINKSAPGKTASVLFQTSYSGRVEIGTNGSDDLSVKVNQNGTAWKEALLLRGATGALSLGQPASVNPAHLTVNHSDTSPRPPFDGTVLHLAGRTNATGRMMIDSAHLQPIINMRLFKNGYDAPVPPAGGELFMRIGAGAWSVPGDVYNRVNINAGTEEAWSATANGSYLSFDTTPPGTITVQERMRISGNGNVGIGTAAPTARLHVNGTVRCQPMLVSALPPASSSGAGTLAFASNEIGGATMVFSDGANWRRFQDRAIAAGL